MDKAIGLISDECIHSGLEFSGNQTGGTITGKGVKISYSADTDSLVATVHKIPFFISWGMINNAIAKNASQYGLALQESW